MSGAELRFRRAGREKSNHIARDEAIGRMKLDALNALAEPEAREVLARCCGSSRWTKAMCAARPFASRAAMFVAADRADATLSRADWLEAFAHHPRIGDVQALREKFAATATWAGDEQKGAAAASDEVLEALARGNHAYERRFGYIFIVCATGRSAAEMLVMLEARIGNDPERELPIAAAEQARITRLRLDKLLEDR
jgi:2-oxo-4-hydroxy-4-carboxy-5-ureidoimidazoline decarboxylase